MPETNDTSFSYRVIPYLLIPYRLIKKRERDDYGSCVEYMYSLFMEDMLFMVIEVPFCAVYTMLVTFMDVFGFEV